MGHVTADEGLVMSFQASTRCWIAFWDGRPTVAFGVAPEALLSDVAAPWMLATEDIREMRTTFLRGSRDYIKRMMRGYEILRNWVDTRNLLSIKWLRWLGFDIHPAKPFGPDQHLFHYFEMRKEKLCASRQQRQESPALSPER